MTKTQIIIGLLARDGRCRGAVMTLSLQRAACTLRPLEPERCPEEPMTKTQIIIGLLARLKAKDDLLVAFRLQRAPKESTFRELDRTKKFEQAAKELCNALEDD